MDKLKSSRTASFLIILAIYLIASFVGIIVYKTLPFDFWLNLLLADIFATVLTFVFSIIFKNASVYDPYWSVQPIVILTYAVVVNGLNTFRLLLLIAVYFWGIRLTANWAYTFKGLNFQDWRYSMLSDTTGKLYPFVNFLGIHMFPTIVVYLCTLPAVFAFHFDTDFNVFNIVFFVVSIMSACLQGVADIQMHRFRKNVHQGFIRTGLWKYARHPNYLGEILMWWGIGLSVVCVMPSRWYLLLGALINTLMFLVISIPMADKRQSRKEGFTEYKNATHKLLPIKKFAKQ